MTTGGRLRGKTEDRLTMAHDASIYDRGRIGFKEAR